MTAIQKKLFDLQDKEYALFQAKLTPTVERNLFIGVRVPACRLLAKNLYKNNADEIKVFLSELPHKYYDENMLHGLLISEIKDFNLCVTELERFLPYVDNWAVCDIMSPKCFKKHKSELPAAIKDWVKSSGEYTIRFGLEMLMSHFLDEDFSPEYLVTAASVQSDKYYVNMMIAWFFATALAKQWDSTVGYIEDNRLEKWVHNKTIQKACESYRISDEQKQYLNKLRR
ncbi:MAG: DNA alkylation repair protein [Sphaerochaetaceae bacterium]|nr:DNA alkylation repair protein [Sphaerochaetaceae bacterium]